MSATNTIGHVLGATTTIGGASALAGATGHHSLTIYMLATTALCIGLIVISKIIKQIIFHLFPSS